MKLSNIEKKSQRLEKQRSDYQNNNYKRKKAYQQFNQSNLKSKEIQENSDTLTRERETQRERQRVLRDHQVEDSQRIQKIDE